ncbi:MAG: ATP-binding protein, partial [Gammaproteobacteria bacterium]|nr:ATP-binding protein [Gammaproteobacteria bacterium]
QLIELHISVVLTNDSSDAINILGQHNSIIDAILIDHDVLLKEPALIAQIRMHHACRHLPIIVANPSGAAMHQGLAISDAEGLKELIPLFKEYSEQKKSLQNDLGSILQLKVCFKTLTQGHFLAELLSRHYPDKNNALVGITELFINAVEHGNLEISYEDKTALLANGRWIEEIEQRSNNEKYSHRTVEVYFEKNEVEIVLVVEDDGKGFKWGAFEQIDPRRMMATHGRGIMMAKSLSFTSLLYEEPGNRVIAIYKLPNTQSSQ